MTTALIIFSICLYALGAYFFLVKKKYCGTESLRFRISCFVLSPIMVPFLLWEVGNDWVHGIASRSSK